MLGVHKCPFKKVSASVHKFYVPGATHNNSYCGAHCARMATCRKEVIGRAPSDHVVRRLWLKKTAAHTTDPPRLRRAY